MTDDRGPAYPDVVSFLHPRTHRCPDCGRGFTMPVIATLTPFRCLRCPTVIYVAPGTWRQRIVHWERR